MKSVTGDNTMYTWILLKWIDRLLYVTQDRNYVTYLPDRCPERRSKTGLWSAHTTPKRDLQLMDIDKAMPYTRNSTSTITAIIQTSMLLRTHNHWAIWKKLIAAHHVIYVVYANLAHKHSNGYPRRCKYRKISQRRL